MKITIGLTQTDVDAIRIMKIIADSRVRYFTEKGIAQGEAREYDNWLDRQRLFKKMEALINNAIDAERTCKMGMIPGLAEETEIPVRRKILSKEEKKSLSDEEVFRQEYGLYTGFVADEYWSGIFKAIYGYSPLLP